MDGTAREPSRRWRRASGTRLFAIYAIASLVPVLLLGLGVNRLVRHEIDQRALDEAVSRAQTIADGSIEPTIGSTPVTTSLTPVQRLRLIQSTAGLQGNAAVLRLRIRSAKGAILFDAAHPAARPVLQADDEVQEAAHGGPVRVLTNLNADEVAEHGGKGDLGPMAVESYVALHAPGTDRVTGVLETYLPYAPFEAAAAGSKRRLNLALMAGLAALWGVLALVTWSVTRRLRATADQNEWLAHHDQLTGLPNRLEFTHRIDEGREAWDVAWVAVVDLARFREVNDTVGHVNGDQFLCCFAERLAESVRGQGTVARIGGDQFGVLWPAVGANSEQRVLAAIHAAAAEHIEVAGIAVQAELSIGLASSTQVEGGGPDLLRAADLANHAAKEAGVEVVGYVPALDEFDPDRLALAGQLGQAIAEGQLVLHYQPKVQLVSGEVTAVEALIRWEHPERGLLRPGDFIGIAETTSLIGPLTRWVVEEAVAQISLWRHLDPPVAVSVNVSARSLADPELPEHILRVLDRAEAPARSLEVEITETSAIADPVGAKALLDRLHRAGVRISLDDFGQGATSLVSLAGLPVDELKVDRSFVLGMEETDAHRSVVEFVIALGHRLGMKVVAEGIETDRAATLLTSMGCDEGQGYLFCHPLPPAELEAWLVAHRQMLADLSARSDATAAMPAADPDTDPSSHPAADHQEPDPEISGQEL